MFLVKCRGFLRGLGDLCGEILAAFLFVLMGQDNLNEITKKIIGAAIAVHRELGPGLLESTYEACLAYEIEHISIEH